MRNPRRRPAGTIGMSTPNGSVGRLTVCPILAGPFPEKSKRFNPRTALCGLILRWLPHFHIQSLPTLFLPMLKKTFLRSLFYAIGKSVVCGFALACLTSMPRLLIAEESTNKLVQVLTRQEGETTRFFVENLEATE